MRVEKERDYAGYAGNPPKVAWPGGARIALNLVINFEEAGELGALPGDPQREVWSETTYPAKPTERELVSESLFEYGSRVGVWRIMRILEKHDATCTIFACGLALERNPEVTQAFVKRAYDMVGHGYRWIGHYGMTEEQERQEIRKTRESIERTTGQRIIGWFTRPMQTPATRRILAEEGFLYDCYALNDDLPYFQEVAGKPFLIVPYTLDQNDTRYQKSQMFTGDDFFFYVRDAFDTLYEEGETHPKMMSVGLHCRLIGRPARALALDRFLAHVRQHKDVWIAKRNDIARFWIETYR
jgi:peptidoglycan/xylan/chitin deacetylase (PgdA/CDA1 family)